MLPINNRLKEKKDFSSIMKYGSALSFPLFNIKYYKKQEGECRFGIVVSNKISKKAVVRNLIKRRLREALRRNKEQFILQTDTIIFAKSKIVNTTYKDIECMILEMFKKVLISHKNIKKHYPINRYKQNS